MAKTEKITYITHDALLAVVRETQKKRRNLHVNLADLAKLDAETRFPVSLSVLHNDHEVRAQFVMDEAGRTLLVDMPVGTFNQLPSVEV